MTDPYGLAENLETLTGLPFVVKSNCIESQVEVSPEQDRLLSRLCIASGLLMRSKLARHYSGRSAAFSEVLMSEVTQKAVTIVARLAHEEESRMVRLERLKDLLEEKSGTVFSFDKDRKILITQDPLTEGTPRYFSSNGQEFADEAAAKAHGSYEQVNPPEAEAKMDIIAQLSHSRTIEMTFFQRKPPSNDIAVFDIDERRLRVVPAYQHNAFSRARGPKARDVVTVP